MKKIITIVLLFSLALPISAQSWISSNVIFGTADVTEVSSTNTSDNGVVSLGFFTGTISRSDISLESYGGRDYFLAKFDDSGNLEWMNQLGGNVSDYVLGGVDEFSPGFIYVSGAFKNYLKYTSSD